MVDITVKDLEGWQARLIIKYADMLKVSRILKDKIEKPYPDAEPIKVGKIIVNPKQFNNCAEIESIINNDPIY